MSKQEFAKKLYGYLRKSGDVKGVVQQIKTVTSNGTEQLEIVNIIRTQGCRIEYFESVDAFLDLVNQVEANIKASTTAGAKCEKHDN
jgi:hypothetical protein